MVAQGHEVSIECSDSLQPQPDVASRGEAQEFRGQVICSRSPIDQRGVDLRDRQTEM